jgi:hypothetical protein
MTPEERAAEFARLTSEIEAAAKAMGVLRNEIATKQVRLDNLATACEAMRQEALALVPPPGDAP